MGGVGGGGGGGGGGLEGARGEGGGRKGRGVEVEERMEESSHLSFRVCELGCVLCSLATWTNSRKYSINVSVTSLHNCLPCLYPPSFVMQCMCAYSKVQPEIDVLNNEVLVFQNLCVINWNGHQDNSPVKASSRQFTSQSFIKTIHQSKLHQDNSPVKASSRQFTSQSFIKTIHQSNLCIKG